MNNELAMRTFAYLISKYKENDVAIINSEEIEAIQFLIEENQELKKQLEDITLCRDIASGHREEVQNRETILLNQQKKFIEYLESEIDRLEKTEFYIDSIQKAAIETHKHNLSKYKEIIGGKK